MGVCTSVFSEDLFIDSIKKKNVEDVKNLATIFNKNRHFKSGDTPLTCASRSSTEEIVGILIQKGADTNKYDKNGYSPLHIAAFLNNHQCVKILIDHAADVNALDVEDTSPLQISADRGHFQVMKLLLDNGATCESKSYFNSPFYLALQNKHSKCLEELSSRKLNPELNKYDNLGHYPLLDSVKLNDFNCAKVLLECGADPNFSSAPEHALVSIAAIHGNNNLIHILLEYGCIINEMQEFNLSPLQAGTVTGNYECVDELLENGANVDVLDKVHNTSLYNAFIALFDHQEESFYCNYFTILYPLYSQFDPHKIVPENLLRCAMSLVKCGADLAVIWNKFNHIISTFSSFTFEQSVLCEVLVQGYGFAEIQWDIHLFIQTIMLLKEYDLILLIYSSGITPSLDDLYLLSIQDDHDNDKIFHWMKCLRVNPRSLKDLCRCFIRQSLNWNIFYLVSHITSLGYELQEYLCIMDKRHYSRKQINVI